MIEVTRTWRSLSREDSASSMECEDEGIVLELNASNKSLRSGIRRHSAGLIKASRRMLRRGSEILEGRLSFRTNRSSFVDNDGQSICPIKDQGVQRAIVSLFQQKKLSNVEMTLLCENVRAISSSELGPFIYDYYKNQLMPRGLRILRDKIEVLAKENGDMLRSLGEVWDNFYQEILPLLQVVLRAIQIKDHNVRNVTLLGFRDIVLLKIDVEADMLDEYRAESPPAIHQMLLVLQSVKDSSPPNERFLQLERLVARVVHPYLGHCGLYTKGNPEPSIRSAHAVVIRCSSDDEPDKANVKWLSQTGFAPSSPASHQDVLSKFRNAKGISHNRLPSSEAMTLEPVLESIEKKQHPRQVALSRKIPDARRHSLSEIMG
ncbi:hypothetical protein CAPTEDRAFT_225833 [Capitella teleta]|uniref:Proline-rich protein 5 n=1 Tax=Capitella teleta TaxID=283909 RepID=R7UEU1_CAPTE|nr:hypothetical protein CAPTEDRAFT_225833 [Capitella teleta]|eukprot:ELU04596.1 hypothetical protein CAPTEDRAFT_225833 [Capitella teleta]